MTATTFDQGEVVALRGQVYLRRLALFMLTTVLVLVVSVVAVQQQLLSP